MINKKLLAVAVATAVSTNAFAAIDISDDAAEAVVFASEFVTAAETLVVINGSGTDSDLDISSPFGFSIAEGTSKYIRLELTNATFNTPITAAMFSEAGVATVGFSISQGGAAGDTSVVIEVSATSGDVQQTDVWTLDSTDFEISQSIASSVTYTLHDDAPDAVANVSALSTQSGPLAVVSTVTSGIFTIASDSTATVNSAFKVFDAVNSDAISGTLGLIGAIDTSLYLTGAGFMADGSAVTAADFITPGQTVTFTGDMSFGDWNTATAADCVTGAVALLGEDEDGADALAVADVNVPLYLCVTLDGTTDVALKGSYSASLDTDALEAVIGEISYDTTSIEVPYLTTFASYNQRVYMINTGATDAAYSITFTSEAAATATPGTAATGTIPAGEMIAIKATDIVTLTGRTRTSAVIEVEAIDSEISAATQSVNLSNGSTDTTVLN